MRLLIVDDDRRMAHTLAAIPSVIGHRADPAHSGREDLDGLQRHRLDYVLTDIEVPETDGIQLCCTIMAAHPQTRCLHNGALL